MSTLNELKYAALINTTGATRPITLNELEIRWLRDTRGRAGTLNEMWIQEFAAKGFTTGSFNGRACGWLKSFGYIGTINERWYQFWLDGGSINPNLVVNGTFDTDTDWAKGLGWTIGGGKACCDGTQVSDSDLAQSVTVSIGVLYRFRYIVSNYSAGLIRPYIGGVALTGTAGNGPIWGDVTPIATGNVTLKADLNYIGCVDNISLREL